MSIEDQVIRLIKRHVAFNGRYPTHLLVTEDQAKAIDRVQSFVRTPIDPSEFCGMKIIVCYKGDFVFPKVVFIQESKQEEVFLSKEI